MFPILSLYCVGRGEIQVVYQPEFLYSNGVKSTPLATKPILSFDSPSNYKHDGQWAPAYMTLMTQG